MYFYKTIKIKSGSRIRVITMGCVMLMKVAQERDILVDVRQGLIVTNKLTHSLEDDLGVGRDLEGDNCIYNIDNNLQKVKTELVNVVVSEIFEKPLRF